MVLGLFGRGLGVVWTWSHVFLDQVQLLVLDLVRRVWLPGACSADVVDLVQGVKMDLVLLPAHAGFESAELDGSRISTVVRNYIDAAVMNGSGKIAAPIPAYV